MSAPKPGRVIITYARSLMALVIARSLAQRGIEVIGCDDVGMTVLSFSKHVKETFTVANWQTNPEQYLQDLECAVRDYAPRDGRPYVLMPVFREIELIAAHRGRFEPLIKVAAPSMESISLVHPKDRLAALVADKPICAPETWTPRDFEELQEVAADVALPAIVKPGDEAGGRGVAVVHTGEELMDHALALGFDSTPIVQEHIEGEDYCVALLAREGELGPIMAYRNLTTFPRNAGAGATRETVDDKPFRDCAKRLVAATKWNGVAQLDFRWDGKKKSAPHLIEVNARFWAGLFHSVESGVDFPWLLYRQTIGAPLDEEADVQLGAVTKSSGVWLLAAIQDVAASDPHFAAAAEAWSAAKHDLKNGKVVKALESAGAALREGVSVGDALTGIRTAVSELDEAPSELSVDDDPVVGLGALFVLSSLLRHGKLPPEVTYTAKAPGEKKLKRRKRPIIGITKPERGDTFSYLAMRTAVMLAGGRPVRVTASAPWDPHTIDGLVFGGGSDVYPKRYEGKPKEGYRYDLARGDMEASWAIAARRFDLPVLGVCRGAQMLNVLAGGTLYADLSSFPEATSPKSPLGKLLFRKPMKVRKGSRLSGIIGAGDMRVNAIHSQAIDRLGAGLTIAAREPNGVVQAVEDKLRRFWIGVQFHPELLIYRPRFLRVFRALVKAAAARLAERQAEEAEMH